MADPEDINDDELIGGELGEEGAGEAATGDADDAELVAMSAKVKEMEDEAEKLRNIQDQIEEGLQEDGVEGGDETDARSVYVGNVDYTVTPEELQELFAPCGTVNRV